jgi:hypothetical protein
MKARDRINARASFDAYTDYLDSYMAAWLKIWIEEMSHDYSDAFVKLNFTETQKPSKHVDPALAEWVSFFEENK